MNINLLYKRWPVKSGILWFCVVLLGCSNKEGYTQQSPANYDLSRPEVRTLNQALEEISGIAFDPADPQSIYAQEDETGTLYQLDLDGMVKQTFPFGKDGDYEDLSVIDNKVYVLKSNGDIFTFPLEEWKSKKNIVPQVYENLVPKGEYEGLAYNPSDGRLYVLCKECKVDKNHSAVTVYQLEIEDELSLSNTLSIPDSLILQTQESKKSFKPSALSYHPVANQWYILSSVNRMLVVADENWQVREAYTLDRKMFPQPEGMAFDQENNLWISNEAGDAGAATILSFTYTTD